MNHLGVIIETMYAVFLFSLSILDAPAFDEDPDLASFAAVLSTFRSRGSSLNAVEGYFTYLARVEIIIGGTHACNTG